VDVTTLHRTRTRLGRWTQVHSEPGEWGATRLVATDGHGRVVGEVETDADPFDPATGRAVDWLVRLTGCDRRLAWREVWRAWRRDAVAT
jgi:hypothetical protein